MKYRVIISTCIFFCALISACTFPSIGIQPESTPISSPGVQFGDVTSTPTFLVPTATEVSPTPSPIPQTSTPTHTPYPSETPTPIPTVSPDHIKSFEELWSIINTEYLYEDFNGVDWDAVHEAYSERISAGMSEDEFYESMREMINLLGDEHSQYFSAEDARREDEEFAGMYDYVGIGIMTTPIFEENRIVIITVFPNSPAEEAGLEVRDSILAADGQPVIQGDTFRHDLLLGPDGSTYTLTVQSPGEAPRDLLMQRRRITGNLEIPYQVLTTPNGKKIAYIFLITFNDDTVDDQVGAAIAELSDAHDLDGIIIDNRVNSGGAGSVLEGVLSYFTSGTIGTYVNREREEDLNIAGRDINGSQNLPLVILTGKETASFGEIFSGALQDINRAYLIGETTGGNVEILYVYNFSDGSRAWIAHDTFQPLNHPEQNWEKTGVIPDLLVEDRWDEVSLDKDEMINAALRYFDEN